MKKGGPEVQIEQMRRAMETLKDVADVIDRGEEGATVSMPLNEAAFAFRIEVDTFRKMGEREQELGISVVDERVVVKLYGGETERREAYQFLFGLTQSIPQGTTSVFLESREVPPNLLEKTPGVKGIIEVLKGSALPDEDLVLLQIHLGTLWVGLRNRAGLPDPAEVFSAVAY